MVLKEIIIRVPTTSNLANLRIPTKLSVVTLKSPETIRTNRQSPHLLNLLAPLVHLIYVLPRFPVSHLRILHQPQHQILRKLHYETHLVPQITAIEKKQNKTKLAQELILKLGFSIEFDSQSRSRLGCIKIFT